MMSRFLRNSTERSVAIQANRFARICLQESIEYAAAAGLLQKLVTSLCATRSRRWRAR